MDRTTLDSINSQYRGQKSRVEFSDLVVAILRECNGSGSKEQIDRVRETIDRIDKCIQNNSLPSSIELTNDPGDIIFSALRKLLPEIKFGRDGDKLLILL
jgi:hypothetical protein